MKSGYYGVGQTADLEEAMRWVRKYVDEKHKYGFKPVMIHKIDFLTEDSIEHARFEYQVEVWIDGDE